MYMLLIWSRVGIREENNYKAAGSVGSILSEQWHTVVKLSVLGTSIYYLFGHLCPLAVRFRNVSEYHRDQ